MSAIQTFGKKNPNLPFHPAVRAGDFVFLSGQVAKDEHGNMVSGTIEEETRATLLACQRILALAGCTFDDVVKVTTFLEDARDFGRYKDVDGDGIPWRTLPGTHPTKGSYFTRGTTRDPYARYSERGPD